MEINHRHELATLLKQRGLLAHAAEIGVAEGRTSLELLQWGFDKLYLVDLWAHVPGGRAELGTSDREQESTFQDCMRRVEAFGDRVVVLRGWSHEMARHVPNYSLDFLFLDASHDYESVKGDLNCWYPKLRMSCGAIFAGHDYSDSSLGVARAVDEFVAADPSLALGVIPGACETDAVFWLDKRGQLCSG